MQERGVWTTDSGTSEAILEFDSDDAGIGATELPAWASGALTGAISGATTGAAAGPYGALIGAAAGGALGAASSAATPAPAASAPADASRARIIQTLQQFAAVVPALVQLLSASKPGGKESSTGDGGDGRERADGSEWEPESFEGTWIVPPSGDVSAIQDQFGQEWVGQILQPGNDSHVIGYAPETFGRDDVEKADKIGKHFLDLLRFEVPARLVQVLAARNMRVQTLQSATGKLNLDFYPVQVSKLPKVDNKQLTAAELLKRIRLNINYFIDTDYSEFKPFDAVDAPAWNSDSPVGAVIYIDIRGPDNAAVLCAHATDRMWRFATIETPRSGEHPVSGMREFGFRETDKGLIFYTRAADRTTSAPPGLDLIGFSAADSLWRSFQQKIAKFVNGNSGEATVLKPLSEQISWTPVKIMYNLGKPQSASGPSRKESSIGNVGDSRESVDGLEWGQESFEGTWTVP